MRVWVFNQEQLDAALKDRPRTGSHAEHDLVTKGIVDFLNSLEAREHKLILEVLDDRRPPAETKP